MLIFFKSSNIILERHASETVALGQCQYRSFFWPQAFNQLTNMFHEFLSFCSYYSYQAFLDFGFPDIFISREVISHTKIKES